MRELRLICKRRKGCSKQIKYQKKIKEFRHNTIATTCNFQGNCKDISNFACY